MPSSHGARSASCDSRKTSTFSGPNALHAGTGIGTLLWQRVDGDGDDGQTEGSRVRHSLTRRRQRLAYQHDAILCGGSEGSRQMNGATKQPTREQFNGYGSHTWDVVPVRS